MLDRDREGVGRIGEGAVEEGEKGIRVLAVMARWAESTSMASQLA